MGNTSLIIVYHIKKKPKYRIVFEFLNLMTLTLKQTLFFEEGLSCLKINIIRKAFSDVVLCLLGYVGINVHGRL